MFPKPLIPTKKKKIYRKFCVCKRIMSINYIYKWAKIFFYVWEVNNYRASKMEMTAFHAHNRLIEARTWKKQSSKGSDCWITK